jgi:hypothetical protein
MTSVSVAAAVIALCAELHRKKRRHDGTGLAELLRWRVKPGSSTDAAQMTCN